MVGYVAKLTETMQRFEVHSHALNRDVHKFKLCGPWRKTRADAEDDGNRLNEIAERLADDLASLDEP